MSASASELLTNTLSADATTREDATRRLDNAARENYPAYMGMLSVELANESAQEAVRTAAGLALKNSLSARETARQTEYSNRWLALGVDAKSKVKHAAISTLASPVTRAGTVAAQVVAAIAYIELPQDQWPELIGQLLGFVNTDQAAAPLKIATLQTIGFICEGIKPEILSLRSNEILTAVIHGARKEETSSDVQLAAIRAFCNSLGFVRENFEREGERNYIMQVVCEATQNPRVEIQLVAFECLVKIMSLYYSHMGLYMEQALFGLTVTGMKHADEYVALQAVEFWTTVCEEEHELAQDALEAAEYGDSPEIESQFFAKVALPEIVPVLLSLLTKQEEDADEHEWNISMSAGTCLNFLAQAVADSIVPAVIPFIEANIKAHDWHLREAAVMTFGSILDGPDPAVLNPLVTQALPLLIGMMADENTHVKDTTAWTLGRICELMITTIKPEIHLHALVSALVNGLQDNPRIKSNSCWALMNLSDQLGTYFEQETDAVETQPLSPYYEGIVAALLQITETTGNGSNFRTAAYEALTSYCSHASKDTIVVVQKTAVAILQRMEQLLAMHNQILGIDDRNNWNDIQGNLCGVSISFIRRLHKGIHPLADRIMTLLLQLIQAAGKTSTVLEDAFLVVGALAASLESRFAPYIPAFLPYLYPALKAHEDSQLCMVSVGIIGDISRALGEASAPYARDFMSVLLENLQSDVMNRNVKIAILSCFGDIALAIGPAFEPYLDTTMGVLVQAGNVIPNPLDYDLMDYVSQLREGILEAYTGVVTGLKNTEKVSLLLPHVASMLDLIKRCLADEERQDTTVKQALGLLGDIADAFPRGELKSQLLQEWIATEVRNKRGLSSETKRTVKWAKEAIKRATAQPFNP